VCPIADLDVVVVERGSVTLTGIETTALKLVAGLFAYPIIWDREENEENIKTLVISDHG
jgi:hypothetical protein